MCFEGGSTESPKHLMFECVAIKWDRKFIFGLEWPPLDSSTKIKPYNKMRPKSGPTKNHVTCLQALINKIPLKVV